MIIGISGISGSGKRLLVQALADRLGGTSLFGDNSRVEALADMLCALKRGQTVAHPTLQTNISPLNPIVLEAPFGKTHTTLARHIDHCFHIDIPLDMALAKRLIDNVDELELNKTSFKQYLQNYLKEGRALLTDEKMCQIAHTADYILDGTKPISKLVDRICYLLSNPRYDEALSITIKVVDKVDKKEQEQMAKGLKSYETNHGVDVNFNKFSLVMSQESRTIGILNAFSAFSEIYIDDIWIDDTYRGQGLGRKLLYKLEALHKGKGYNNINLVTSAFQAPEFYEKCGYKLEFVRVNEKNPPLTKHFFVKFFGEHNQLQGIHKKSLL